MSTLAHPQPNSGAAPGPPGPPQPLPTKTKPRSGGNEARSCKKTLGGAGTHGTHGHTDTDHLDMKLTQVSLTHALTTNPTHKRAHAHPRATSPEPTEPAELTEPRGRAVMLLVYLFIRTLPLFESRHSRSFLAPLSFPLCSCDRIPFPYAHAAQNARTSHC